MQSVYVETSIFSYLAANKPADAVSRIRQESARLWWRRDRRKFRLFTSPATIEEAMAGDPDAAQRRLGYTKGLELLAPSAKVIALAEKVFAVSGMPLKARADAVHIATAAVYRMDFLLTLNFKHIENAVFQSRIRPVCSASGFELPIICTPEELLGGFEHA